MIDIASIEGAIFDADGTLLDSMPAWDNVASNYLKSRGKTPRPGLNDEMRALGGHEIPQYFQTEYGITVSEAEIRDSINDLLQDFYSHTAPLKAGVIGVLDFFRSRGIKMCVATASGRHLIEPALRRCGVLEYFGRIFTCDEEITSKRCPDIYLRAAGFLGTKVRGTIVFEDALYAIKTVKNAGFPVVAVHDSSADDQQNEIMGLCDMYLKSFEDSLF